MRRGTTPTLTITLTNGDGTACDLTTADNYVTFSEVGTSYKFTKENADLAISTSGLATVIGVTLSQEETLGFKANHVVQVQVRSKIGDVAIASEVAKFNVGEILLEGEI